MLIFALIYFYSPFLRAFHVLVYGSHHDEIEPAVRWNTHFDKIEETATLSQNRERFDGASDCGPVALLCIRGG